MIDSGDMAAFVQVVESGSFAAAAKELKVTPSAVSKTITRLEQGLGTQLLTRTTRRLVLTDEGQTYLLRCREILAAIEAAEAEIASAGAGLQGHIRVSSSTAIGRYQLTALLPEFLAAHPGITIDLGISDQRVDLVSENIDVALRAGPLADSSLVCRKMVEARRVICASPSYLKAHGMPKQPEDLLCHNCILIADFPQLARWPFYTSEGITRIHVNGNITTNNADVMLDLALAGQGIIRNVDIHVLDAVHRGALVPILSDQHVDEAIPIWALSPPGRNRLPRVQAFVDFLTAHFAAV